MHELWYWCINKEYAKEETYTHDVHAIIHSAITNKTRNIKRAQTEDFLYNTARVIAHLKPTGRVHAEKKISDLKNHAGVAYTAPEFNMQAIENCL